MICFLDHRDLRENSSFELSFLLIIGSLLDVCDFKPVVFKEILCSRPGIIIYINASLKDIGVFPSDLLIINVIGSSLNSPV